MKAVAVLVVLLGWTASTYARLDYEQQQEFDEPEFAVCDDMYFSIAGKCFRFHQSRHSWDAARTQCQREGGDLASVTNQAEYTGLLSHINGNYPGTYWTSGRTMDRQWSWAAKEGRQAIMNDGWWGRRPSHANNRCAYFCSNTNKYWDKECSRSLRFICQKSYGGLREVESV